MYGYIYKTTNLINKKIYIGQKKSNEFLGNLYLGSGKYLKSAIKHYGESNFNVELLAQADTQEQLNELEIFYIKEYNSINHSIGYNITSGSIGGDTYSGLSMADKYKRDKKLKGRKLNLGYKRIHKGNIDKAVPESMLQEFLNKGWSLGVSDRIRHICSTSHKGIKQSDEWIKKRVNSGWKNKSSEEYEKMRQKHREAAIKQMANTPKEERIRRAKNANKFKGHKCKFVHKGEETHFIYEEDLQKYLYNGFELGMGRKEK